MNYADSSFLVSLYLTDAHSAEAHSEADRMKHPLVLTPLHRIELRNALNFAINRGRIDIVQRDAVWLTVQSDLIEGFLVEVNPSTLSVLRRAESFSDLFTPVHALRSLDLLHVAAAVDLGSETFYSFDKRQRIVSLAEGLTVKPSTSDPEA